MDEGIELLVCLLLVKGGGVAVLEPDGRAVLGIRPDRLVLVDPSA